MILSDKTIKSMLDSKQLVARPLCEESLQSASLDCRLGDHFLRFKNKKKMISLSDNNDYEDIRAKNMIIEPHSFLLATTMEYIELPHNITSFVEGRSSVGRIGLFIQNAGWIDPGFKGHITLELYNATALPIQLTAGRRICQLVFCKMDQSSQTPYKGKYQGQMKTTGSKISEDIEVATL